MKQFADSIYAMLNRKAAKKVNPDIYSLEYGVNKMGIRDRLKQIEIMTRRKAGFKVDRNLDEYVKQLKALDVA